MAITKSGTQVTVEYQTGDPKGNIADPFTYQDVVDFLDPANVYQNGDTIIFKDIWIYIEGSETAFVDNNRDVSFSGDTGDWRVESVKSEVAKHELTNCVIRNTSTSFMWEDITTNVYSRCSFYGINRFVHYGFHDDCFFKDVRDLYAKNNNSYNNVFAYLNRGFRIQGSSSINTLLIIDADNGIMVDGKYFSGTLEINNVQLINCTNDLVYRLVDNDVYVTVKNSVINFDNSVLWDVEAGNCTMTVSATKEIRANILNSVNGTLKLYNKDGGLIHSEVLTSDEMTEQEIEYDRLYLENTDGELTTEERIIKEPFTIEVTKQGYQKLVIPGIYMTDLQDDGSRKGTLSAKTVSGKMEEIKTLPYVYKQNLEITDQFDRPLANSQVQIELGSQAYTGSTDSSGFMELESNQRFTYDPNTEQLLIEQDNGTWETVSQLESGSILSQSTAVDLDVDYSTSIPYDPTPITYDYKQHIKLTDQFDRPLSGSNILISIGEQTYSGSVDSQGELDLDSKHKMTYEPDFDHIKFERQVDGSWHFITNIESGSIVSQSTDINSNINDPDSITYDYKQILLITDQFDRPLANSQVNIDLGSQSYTGTTDSFGYLEIDSTYRISCEYESGNVLIEQYNSDSWSDLTYLEPGSVVSQSIDVSSTVPEPSPVVYDYKQNIKLTDRSGEPMTNCYVSIGLGKQSYKGSTDSSGQLKLDSKQRISYSYENENILIEQDDGTWSTVQQLDQNDSFSRSTDIIVLTDEPLKTKLDDYYDDLKTKLVYIENNKPEYEQNEYPKIIVKLRDKYPTLTYYGKQNYESDKLLPETTYYSVINERTSETVINKSDYTKLSSALDHNYFYFDMSSLDIGQYYRFRIHMITDQNEYHIFDNKYIFKIKQTEN